MQKFKRAIVCVDHHNHRYELLFTSHFAQEEIKFAAVTFLFTNLNLKNGSKMNRRYYSLSRPTISWFNIR